MDDRESAGPRLEEFPIQTRDKVRYADTDRQGHVNNAVFATFLETGRVEILYNPEEPLTDDGAAFVIARLSLDFRAEIQWPGEVQIGTRVLRVGRSSLTLHQAIFQHEQCAAEAETVIVQVDEDGKVARPLNKKTLDRLQDLRITSDDPQKPKT